MLLIVQKIIILSSSTVKLYTCQWPGVIPQLYSSFRVLTRVLLNTMENLGHICCLREAGLLTVGNKQC